MYAKFWREVFLFRIDIIGTKLNRRHVEYLTSRRFDRLSINQQKRSAVLIDNSKAECTEKAAGEVYGEAARVRWRIAFGSGSGKERERERERETNQ